MFQDASFIQVKLTKKQEEMDKGNIGMIMVIFLEANTIIPRKLKERCMNCKQMALAHSFKSNMIKKKKKVRGKK
jgi:hypothetical protein